MLFDNERYLEAQVEEILRRMRLAPKGGRTYIEFGGKPYDDQHAARVLPGYDPHVKLRLLRELTEHFEIVVVVSARDILRPRIRGDSQLFYDRETIRIIRELADAGVVVHHGVLSMVREETNRVDRAHLDRFLASAKSELGVEFVEHGFIAGYPDVEILSRPHPFANSPRIETDSRNILVFSPGGGSGKFGVILSQLWHDFVAGVNSIYLKFETFPVFALPPDHPVNLAFVAATADLGNRVMCEREGGFTTYDKDVENFALLMALLDGSCPDPDANPISDYRHPSDMGVNRLQVGMLNDGGIREAAKNEIARRVARYREEIGRRIERPATLRHLAEILPLSLQSLMGT